MGKAGPGGWRIGDHYDDKDHGKVEVVGFNKDKIRVRSGDGSEHEYGANEAFNRRKKVEARRPTWHYVPKGKGSDDGYDAMKDKGFRSDYYRLRGR